MTAAFSDDAYRIRHNILGILPLPWEDMDQWTSYLSGRHSIGRTPAGTRCGRWRHLAGDAFLQTRHTHPSCGTSLPPSRPPLPPSTMVWHGDNMFLYDGAHRRACLSPCTLTFAPGTTCSATGHAPTPAVLTAPLTPPATCLRTAYIYIHLPRFPHTSTAIPPLYRAGTAGRTTWRGGLRVCCGRAWRRNKFLARCPLPGLPRILTSRYMQEDALPCMALGTCVDWTGPPPPHKRALLRSAALCWPAT